MFLSYIHQFNDLTIILGTLLISVVVIGSAPFIGRSILRLTVSEERYSAALDGFKGIASVLGILVAFSLVQANGNLRTVQEQVAKEASLAQTLDRGLLRSGQPDLVALRPLVTAYLQTRVAKEWPAMARGERSPETGAAYSSLSKAIRGMTSEESKQPALYAEVLKTMDDLSDMRELTLSESDPEAFSLGSFYWTTILIFCVIAFLLALLTRPSVHSVASIAATTSAISLLVAMLMVVDLPFQGQTSVSTDPLVRAIAINQRRN